MDHSLSFTYQSIVKLFLQQVLRSAARFTDRCFASTRRGRGHPCRQPKRTQIGGEQRQLTTSNSTGDIFFNGQQDTMHGIELMAYINKNDSYQHAVLGQMIIFQLRVQPERADSTTTSLSRFYMIQARARSTNLHNQSSHQGHVALLSIANSTAYSAPP